MSVKKKIIEISPPDYCFDEETLEFSDFVCNKCNGRKVFVTIKGHNKFESKQCPYCDGTGKIKAVINITWKPSKSNRYDNK